MIKIFDNIKIKFLQKFHPDKYNDVYLRPNNKIYDGIVPMERKAAIYLIFPKTGVLKSHLVALRYMIENGYSPIVVSNQPLNSADISQLQGVSYRILERDNFGYDFGGYREAVLIFKDILKNLDRLAIFNDSVWFPVHNRANWLADAESANRDLVGALSNDKVSRENLHAQFSELAALSQSNVPLPNNEIAEQSWIDDFSKKLVNYKLAPGPILAFRNYLRDRRIRAPAARLHYCSFALLISGKMLTDPKFMNFWEQLKISNDWIRTIINGEIGFSQWVIKNGYSHHAILDAVKIRKNLESLSLCELMTCVNESALIGMPRPYLETYNQVLTHKKIPAHFNRGELIIFFMSMLKYQCCAYTAPNHLMTQHDFMFIKKKIITWTKHPRNSAIKMIEFIDDPIKSEMQEMIDKTAKWYLPSDKNNHLKSKGNITGRRKMFGVLVGVPRIWD